MAAAHKSAAMEYSRQHKEAKLQIYLCQAQPSSAPPCLFSSQCFPGKQSKSVFFFSVKTTFMTSMDIMTVCFIYFLVFLISLNLVCIFVFISVTQFNSRSYYKICTCFCRYLHLIFQQIQVCKQKMWSQAVMGTRLGSAKFHPYQIHFILIGDKNHIKER